MALSGQLKDYALPELLTTIEQGGKTGMLTIRAFNESENEFKKTYLSFKNGYLIAVSEDSMSRDLVRLMALNKFLDHSIIESLITMEEEFQLHLPVGSYLQTNNKINDLQLKKLFNVQVIERAVRLYALSDAWFTFNSRVRASMLELTGLQLKANNLNLLGLRALQNWDHLLDRLPEESFALIKNPQMSMEVSLSVLMPEKASDFSTDLHPLEEEIVQYSDGKTSLSEIAAILNLPLLEIQKVAFQLIFAGYVDELPMVAASPVAAPSINKAPSVVTAELRPNPTASVNSNPPVNSSFLQNLSSFLKGKTLTKV
jgi:Domain of unknown function (DUF4388)